MSKIKKSITVKSINELTNAQLVARLEEIERERKIIALELSKRVHEK